MIAKYEKIAKSEELAKMENKKYVTVYGDGIHDDTEALQLVANGKAKGILPDGRSLEFGAGMKYHITKPIEMKSSRKEI